jgi:3-deoxy-manno-octulosonate cytidylyltransferase (CMP-KDO synthetase)
VSSIAIIPARYGSQRLPAKALSDLNGLPLIVHTWRQTAAFFGQNRTWVATDDQRIHQSVEAYGGKAIMTRIDHRSGTERVAEAALKLADPGDIVVNVQGDEPFVARDELEALVELMQQGVQIGTLVEPLEPNDPDLEQPSRIKVARGAQGRAVYFSRTAVPYSKKPRETQFWRHLGMYAYRYATLLELVRLPVHALEEAERLEQLRWLAHGYAVYTAEVEARERYSVDTAQDLEAARKYLLRRDNETPPSSS